MGGGNCFVVKERKEGRGRRVTIGWTNKGAGKAIREGGGMVIEI
jgi:hypothetical protein